MSRPLSDRLEELLTLSEKLGIEVRAEFMGGGGGGLCQLKGAQVLFVDTSADVTTRYERTLAALATLPEIEEHFVTPEVRKDLESLR